MNLEKNIFFSAWLWKDIQCASIAKKKSLQSPGWLKMHQIDPPKVQRWSFMFGGPLRVPFILQPCVVKGGWRALSFQVCSCLFSSLRSAVSLLDTSEELLTDCSLASVEISVSCRRSHLHFPSCDFAEWIRLWPTWSRYLMAPQVLSHCQAAPRVITGTDELRLFGFLIRFLHHVFATRSVFTIFKVLDETPC